MSFGGSRNASTINDYVESLDYSDISSTIDASVLHFSHFVVPPMPYSGSCGVLSLIMVHRARTIVRSPLRLLDVCSVCFCILTSSRV